MMLGTAFIDYRVWRRWALPLYVVTLALLVFITFKGHAALGASRWIAVGPFQFQPSEPAKVVLAIAIAALLSRGTFRKIQELWLPLLAVGAARAADSQAARPRHDARHRRDPHRRAVLRRWRTCSISGSTPAAS